MLDTGLMLAAEKVATGANAHTIRQAMAAYVMAEALDRDVLEYERNLRLVVMEENGIRKTRRCA